MDTEKEDEEGTRKRGNKTALELDLEDIDNQVDYENLSFWDYQAVRWKKFRAKFRSAQRGDTPNIFSFFVHVTPIVQYIMFAMLTTFVAWASTPSEMDFYFEQSITREFTMAGTDRSYGNFWDPDAPAPKLPDILVIDDIYKWLRGPFLDVFRPTNAKQLLYKPGYGVVPKRKWPGASRVSFLGYNLLLGGARIRQIRVQQESCELPDGLKAPRYCYPPLTNDNMRRTSIFEKGGARFRFQVSDYQPQGELQRYPNGGYMWYLDPLNQTLAEQEISFLQRIGWIDVGTRAVVVDMNVYCPNLHVILIMSILFELPAGGGVLASVHRELLMLDRNDRFIDIVNFFAKGVFILLMLINLRLQLLKIWYNGFEYFKDFWNLVVAFQFSVMMCGLLVYFTRVGRMGERYLDPNEYIELYDISSLLQLEKRFMSFAVMATWFSVLRFSVGFQHVGMFQKMLSKALVNIFPFLIFLALIFFSFVAAFHFCFAATVRECSTVYQTMIMLFQIFLGKFKFEELYKTQRILAPLLFSFMVILGWWTLVNMFVAILSDEYATQKREYKADYSFVWDAARVAWSETKKSVKRLSERFTNMGKELMARLGFVDDDEWMEEQVEEEQLDETDLLAEERAELLEEESWNETLMPEVVQKEIASVMSKLLALRERARKAQEAADRMMLSQTRLAATVEVLSTQAAGMPQEFQKAAEKACGQGTEFFESTVRALDWLGDILSKEARLDSAIMTRTTVGQPRDPPSGATQASRANVAWDTLR